MQYTQLVLNETTPKVFHHFNPAFYVNFGIHFQNIEVNCFIKLFVVQNACAYIRYLKIKDFFWRLGLGRNILRSCLIKSWEFKEIITSEVGKNGIFSMSLYLEVVFHVFFSGFWLKKYKILQNLNPCALIRCFRWNDEYDNVTTIHIVRSPPVGICYHQVNMDIGHS